MQKYRYFVANLPAKPNTILEALWALAKRTPSWWPDEAILFATPAAAGAWKSRITDAAPGHSLLDQLLRALEVEDGQKRLSPHFSFPLSNVPRGNEIGQIRDQWEADVFMRAYDEVFSSLLTDPSAEVYALAKSGFGELQFLFGYSFTALKRSDDTWFSVRVRVNGRLPEGIAPESLEKRLMEHQEFCYPKDINLPERVSQNGMVEPALMLKRENIEIDARDWSYEILRNSVVRKQHQYMGEIRSMVVDINTRTIEVHGNRIETIELFNHFPKYLHFLLANRFAIRKTEFIKTDAAEDLFNRYNEFCAALGEFSRANRNKIGHGLFIHDRPRFRNNDLGSFRASISSTLAQMSYYLRNLLKKFESDLDFEYLEALFSRAFIVCEALEVKPALERKVIPEYQKFWESFVIPDGPSELTLDSFWWRGTQEYQLRTEQAVIAARVPAARRLSMGRAITRSMRKDLTSSEEKLARFIKQNYLHTTTVLDGDISKIQGKDTKPAREPNKHYKPLIAPSFSTDQEFCRAVQLDRSSISIGLNPALIVVTPVSRLIPILDGLIALPDSQYGSDRIESFLREMERRGRELNRTSSSP